VPDLDWNKTIWGSTYGWQDQGEEWSTAWGRWTKFLLPAFAVVRLDLSKVASLLAGPTHSRNRTRVRPLD
jgi:hypothetical protein